MRSVPAVRPGGDIAASTCGSAGTAMTCCAAVGQPCANRPIGVEVPDAVAFIASLSLHPREFALEELPSTPDGAKRVPLDNEDRGAPTGSDAASGASVGRQG